MDIYKSINAGTTRLKKSSHLAAVFCNHFTLPLPYLSEGVKTPESMDYKDKETVTMKQEELENYISTFGRDLYSFCCSLTHSRHQADDLYQNTFLKMYDMGEQLIIKTNPKSYIMGIALNLYRNDKRKMSVRQRITGINIPAEENADIVSDNGQSTEDMILEKEQQRIVREAVRKLPDRYRIPTLLYYMEELSVSEIAALINLTESTVKSRLHRARKILKERLEGLL